MLRPVATRSPDPRGFGPRRFSREGADQDSVGVLGRPLLGERLSQALAGAGEEGPGGDVADAEDGRQLEARQIVELGEEERCPLALGDPLERPGEIARQPEVHRQVLG